MVGSGTWSIRHDDPPQVPYDDSRASQLLKLPQHGDGASAALRSNNSARDRGFHCSFHQLSLTKDGFEHLESEVRCLVRTPNKSHRTTSIRHTNHLDNRTPPSLWKPILSSTSEPRKRSSTKFWITQPRTQTLESSEYALLCPKHGSRRVDDTSSTPLASLQGMWTGGSRRSRYRRRVPSTTSGNCASGL